eukprot:Rhum_TRINITY_DN11838_c0_g1::Rhum_TRINITY_DN11838_c0_g1_i1::g.47515::m.47515
MGRLTLLLAAAVQLAVFVSAQDRGEGFFAALMKLGVYEITPSMAGWLVAHQGEDVADLPDVRMGCAIDHTDDIMFYMTPTADVREWALWSFELFHKANDKTLPVQSATIRYPYDFIKSQTTLGLAVDHDTKSLFFSYEDDTTSLLRFFRLEDYASKSNPKVTKDANEFTSGAEHVGGDGGSIIIYKGKIFALVTLKSGEKAIMTNSIASPGAWTEMATFKGKVANGHTLGDMVAGERDHALFVSASDGTWPGYLVKVDSDDAAPAQVYNGIVEEFIGVNRPSIGIIGDAAEDFLGTVGVGRKKRTKGQKAGQYAFLRNMDGSIDESLATAGPSSTMYMAPLCWSGEVTLRTPAPDTPVPPMDDCLKKVCGDDQECEDADMMENMVFTCKCIAPQTGTDGMNAKAVCMEPADDCEAKPCGDDQDCKDADMMKNMMFTCDCVAPATGDQGMNAKATCTTPDDCEAKPCGDDQDCKDADMMKNMMFTCDCVAPATGDQGMNAKATCTGPDDCADNPCGDDQDCKDADMMKDMVFTCDCKAPAMGAQGMNAKATCAVPMDDCESKPCGDKQTCSDADGTKDAMYTCSCIAPQTGMPGMAAMAMCKDPGDDCEANPCGDDQVCTDADGTADMMFTCDCKPPAAGETGTSARAAACVVPPMNDCLTNPCGDTQRCTDADDSQNSVWTCECVAPQIGVSAKGTKADCLDPIATPRPTLAAAPAPKEKSDPTMIVVIVCAVLIALCVGCVAVFLYMKRKREEEQMRKMQEMRKEMFLEHLKNEEERRRQAGGDVSLSPLPDPETEEAEEQPAPSERDISLVEEPPSSPSLRKKEVVADITMNADDGWNRVASGRIYSGSPAHTGSDAPFPSSPQSTAAFAPIGVAAAGRRSVRSGRNHSVRASQQLGALDSGRWGGTDAGGSDLERSLLPSDAPPKGPTIRERIEAIYGVHSPEKLEDVDDMIDRYGEKALLDALITKYGEDSAWSPHNKRATLSSHFADDMSSVYESTSSPLMPPYRDISSSGRVQSIRM